MVTWFFEYQLGIPDVVTFLGGKGWRVNKLLPRTLHTLVKIEKDTRLDERVPLVSFVTSFMNYFLYSSEINYHYKDYNMK